MAIALLSCNRPLRGAVDRFALAGDHRKVGRNIDDAAVTLGHHVPEGRPRTTHERRHVHLHDARPILVAGVENTAAMGDTGIVDEDVEAAEDRQCLGNQAIGKGWVGDVAREKARAQFIGERRAGGLIAARQHQLSARGRDLPGYGAANPRRRSCHQCSFSRQFSQDALLAGCPLLTS
jgi:hypothetical protein